MNCLAVRDRLAEQALGALPTPDAPAIERHLGWCAACRREADELQGAAATLALTLAPAAPPVDLAHRVIGAVHDIAGSRSRPPRRTRTAAALVVAAMVAVSGLGWGAVMAGRADRFRERAAAAAVHQEDTLQRFARILVTPPFQDPHNQVFMGTLNPASGVGGGAAITLVSPTIIDMAIVTVAGLPPSKASALPYSVSIADDAGHVLTVGRITALDTDGGGQIVRNFNRDLLGFTKVVVRDSSGALVMSGAIAQRAVVASPTP